MTELIELRKLLDSYDKLPIFTKAAALRSAAGVLLTVVEALKTDLDSQRRQIEDLRREIEAVDVHVRGIANRR